MLKNVILCCLLLLPFSLLAQDNRDLYTDLLYANSKIEAHRTSTRVLLDGEDLSANHVRNGYGPIVADAEKGIVLVRHYDTGLEEFKTGNVQILFVNESAKNAYLAAYYQAGARYGAFRFDDRRESFKLPKPFLGKIRKLYIERID